MGGFVLKNLCLFVIGAFGYGAIEILFRGFTHWTMVVTGGICLIILWYIVMFLHFTPIIIQAIVGGICITVFEFIVGIIVNLWLGWNVWDYSSHTINLLGQISLQFTLFWVLLSAIICFIMRIIKKMMNLRAKKTNLS